MPERKAHPPNVEGPFYVEDRCCLTCSLPETVAPDMFRYTEEKDHCYVYQKPRTKDQLDRMIEAMEGAELACIRCRSRDHGLLAALTKNGLEVQCDTEGPATVSTNIPTTRFRIWGLVQVSALLVFLGWKFYTGTSAYLAHPTDSDANAHTWLFQGIVCCIFGLLPALVGAAFVLRVEWFIIKKLQRGLAYQHQI
jgi:hypothetical protein